jgi:type IV pilus assembly protein PilM
MIALPTWLSTPPPDVAVALAPESVAVAVLGGAGRDAHVQGYAIEPLRAGALAVSMTAPNVVDSGAVGSTLRAALERLGGRPRRVALVIPDAVARVSLVRFEQVPAKADDLAQLVRWQVKKSAPFPVEDAALAFAPAAPTGDGGREFVAVLARREIVREYEEVCEGAGMHPGLVDLSTFGLLNLFSASAAVPAGDWLLVHVRPDYASLAIMRHADLIYFRHLSEADATALADVVHQTAMYYQDRLAGRGFSRVVLAGIGRTAGALEATRQGLEERLGIHVGSIEEAASTALIDSIAEAPELMASLAPLAGTLARMRAEAVGV